MLAIVRRLSIVGVLLTASTATQAQNLECTQWQTEHPEWLWCDDFEDDSRIEQDYFDVQRVSGRLRVDSSEAFLGNSSLRTDYQQGQTNAGTIKLSLGATPVSPKRYLDRNFDELYWRFYMFVAPGFEGNPRKVTRATVFTASNWTQAAIAHLWEGMSLNLSIDPVSLVTGSSVDGNGWNDFGNMQWLGAAQGSTQVYASGNQGKWLCVEVQFKLNAPGSQDGELAFWIDDQLEARRTGLNWRGSYTAYGINMISLESWTNGGAPKNQTRYFDNFVVSESRIGCVADTLSIRPSAPTNLAAE